MSGIVYPLGGQIHRWLADTYGDWRVATMYKEQNRHDSFEAAIQAVYGRTLDQLSDEFQLAMRRRYYPSVDSLAPLTVLGTRGREARGEARLPARYQRRLGRGRLPLARHAGTSPSIAAGSTAGAPARS